MRDTYAERLERGALALCRRELIDLIPNAPDEVLGGCAKACATCLATVADILEVTDAID